MRDTREFETQLRKRRAALTKRIEGAEADLSAPHSHDWEEQAVEREPEEVIEALSETDREEVRSIEAALERIAKNVFGDCVTCGDPISEARLIVLPATPYCRNCARQSEVDLFENVPV